MALLAACCSLLPPWAGAAPNEGLWAGRAILNSVNEVVSAVDENNVRIQTPPDQTTPTSDSAELFLILHVDGGGTVRLLKSVAIVDTGSDPLTIDEKLLTDPQLFVSHPIARRLAAAAFEFGDPRSRAAIGGVADAAAQAAAQAVATAGGDRSAIVTAARNAAQQKITDTSGAAGLPPSLAEFLTGSGYQNSADAAAQGAADAVLAAQASGATGDALLAAARSGVLVRLQTLSQQADSVSLNELPLTGSLTPGDSVSGEIFLGAYHPLNPFRHRRHPSHRGGYDITRRIRLAVSQPESGGEFDTTERGLDRLEGIYEEEIFGLHKPLGQSADIGLRTRGTFVLDRISRKATINN